MPEPIALLHTASLDDKPVTRADFARIEVHMTRFEAQMEMLVRRLAPVRSKISDGTKRQHLNTVLQFFGGLCPCCGRTKIVTGESRSLLGQFDHFFDNRNRRGPHETWLICFGCHKGFSGGIMPRDAYRPHFDHYQLRRRDANTELPLPHTLPRKVA